MLLIKILSGSQAGQIIPLKQEGVLQIGRSPSCDIALMSNGVSKRHAEISFNGDKVQVKDLDSSNGTVVNGVQVRSQRLEVGDKIAFHDILVELINEQHLHSSKQYIHPSNQGVSPFQQSMPQPNPYRQQSYGQPMATPYMQDGNAAVDHQYSQEPSEYGESEEEYEEETGPDTLLDRFNEYLEDVVLPGVYRLPQMLDFKWVLGIFMGAYIVLVTSLSTIPLLRILKSSVERESQEHALTIAKTLAEVNAAPLSQGLNTAVSVAIALKRPGVEKALIISDVDGAIIAPASKAGSYPDIDFVHDGRKRGKESVAQVDSGTVVAMVPLEFYNPETGSRAITAYSVVVYDMASLAVDDGKTISLFIQTLFIALVIGSLLFFFLYRMILYPIVSMNIQLNDALKNDTSQIEVDYEFDALKELAGNISSALSRTQDSGSGGDGALTFEADRYQEMSNLVELVGFGAFTVSASDMTVTAVNSAFEDSARINSHDLISNTVAAITDQALKLSIEDLIERSATQPDQIILNDLEFSGDQFQLALSPVQGSSGVAYYLFVLYPGNSEGDVE